MSQTISTTLRAPGGGAGKAARRAVLPDRLATGRESRQDDQQAEEPRQACRACRGCRL